MKRFIPYLFSAILSLFFVFPAQAAETYKLDPHHTYVLWYVDHFGFSDVTGKWLANGTLTLDQKNPQNSQLNVTIDMSGLTTGIPELDNHLKAGDFFDVQKYPKATFVSTKVEPTGSNTAKVSGNLTIRGITKPVVLSVTLRKIGESVINNKQTAGFTATAIIKRSDFDVARYTPAVSNDARLLIEAEATLDGGKAEDSK